MDYIKKVVKEEFPHYSDEKIEDAIKKCCEEIDPPRPRDGFMICLEKRL